MAKYLDKWKTDFPASVGNVTRPTDGIDDTLDFNSDGFPQRISSDPVHYKLENDMASQLFSNDARLKESIEANKKAEDDALANHNKSASSHVNGIAGNAASATKLKTARTINVTGDCLTGTAASFDGSANANIPVALCAVLKALGALSPTADKLPYFTGANAAALADLSSFMRGLLSKADAASVRSAIGIANATQSNAGYMSAADKTKLDGIAAKANNYSLPTASSSVLGGVKVGSNLSISNGVLSALAASQSVAGYMSAADKKKLDGIASGANAYSLPTASASTLGGVKVGSGLKILGGILSANAESLGVVTGNVSNANAWWVKLGGSIPLIIQGGKLKARGATTVTLPVAFNSPICVCITDILESGHFGYAPNLHEISTSSMSITCGYNTGRTSGTLWIAFGI